MLQTVDLCLSCVLAEILKLIQTRYFYRIRYLSLLFFSALRGMSAWTSDEKGVRLSVCLSNAWIVTKRNKDLARFLYRTKDHSA